MKFALVFAGLFALSPAFACVRPELSDYLVYATEGITADSSDYQGLVGSGGNINLSRFNVIGNEKTCLAVTSYGSTSVSDATISLGIESAGEIDLLRMKAQSIVASNFKISLSNASIDGDAFAPRLEKNNASIYGKYTRAYINMHAQHEGIPGAMSALSEGWKITSESGTKVTSSNGETVVTITENIAVKNVDASFFKSGSFTVLKGKPGQILVINISGTNVRLADFHVYLDGISPDQVLLNFPDTVVLTIRNTGNGVEGLPATILAPKAELNFVEALVTGQVLVRRINPPLKGEHSGQVNAAYFMHPSSGKPLPRK